MGYWSGGWGDAVSRTRRSVLHAAQHPGNVSSAALPLFALLGRNRSRPALRADDADLIAVDDAVGWRVDDAVFQGDARGQFDIASEIARDLHGLEQDAIVRPDGGDAKAVLVEDQRARWNVQRHAVALQVQAHIGEGARHQFTSGVVEGELHLRGAGIDIDRLRGSFDHRIEGTV